MVVGGLDDDGDVEVDEDSRLVTKINRPIAVVLYDHWQLFHYHRN